MITAVDKHKCAERELKFRLLVYPRWIEAGRMTQAKADVELATMRAIAEDYRVAAAKEAAKGRLI